MRLAQEQIEVNSFFKTQIQKEKARYLTVFNRDKPAYTRLAGVSI